MKIIASNGREVALSQNSQKISHLLDIVSDKCGYTNRQAACGDHKVKNSEQQNLGVRELPSLLRRMSIMNFKGEVYSGSAHTVYTEEFAKCVMALLHVFLSVVTSSPSGPKRSVSVNLPSCQVRNAVKWIDVIAEDARRMS